MIVIVIPSAEDTQNTANTQTKQTIKIQDFKRVGLQSAAGHITQFANPQVHKERTHKPSSPLKWSRFK